MNIINAKNYDEMSHIACEILIHCLREKPDALFCIATGSSPTGAYKEFVKRIKTENLDTGKMRIIKLDEWLGLEKNNPATCEYYIAEHILQPLGISPNRYISFDPKELDSERECGRIATLLKENGGIDCCVLGLGKNGHLGLNEPQEEIDPFIHKATLDAKTQTHSMLTSNSTIVSEGYTLGIKDILNSREILFLVTGDGKQEAYENFLNKKISSKYPANYLWLHGNTSCVVDGDCVM